MSVETDSMHMLFVLHVQIHTSDWVHGWNPFYTSLCLRRWGASTLITYWYCVCAHALACLYVCLDNPLRVRVLVWENTDKLMGLFKLCVLALSGRPLLWRRRSGGLTRRPRYICLLELGMQAWWITSLGVLWDSHDTSQDRPTRLMGELVMR